MDQTNASCHGSFPLSNNINTTSVSTTCNSSSSNRNNVIDDNRENTDQAGCTNTGIISNEMSDKFCRELCGFQNPHLIDNSDKIVEPYSGFDNDSDSHDNDESEIGNTDNCYQDVRSGENNNTTHFVKIKSEPKNFVKRSNHITCTETEVIGSHRSIENAEVPIKMEPITCDAFDPSCCMLTDKLAYKSGENSFHVHEQLCRSSSNSTNYAICIKYEPDSGAEGESHTSGSIASPSRSEVKTNSHQIRENSRSYSNCGNISDNVLNQGDQPNCGPINIEINDSHMRKDSVAPTSPRNNSCRGKSAQTVYHNDTCCVKNEQLHSPHKNVNIQEGKQPEEKQLTTKQTYTKGEYKCNMCSYSATRSDHLVEHKARHMGEKPYKCDMCSYSSVRSRDLVRHIKRKHTGEKQYKCDMCSYCATESSDLVTHKRKHTGEKPYKCDVCSYSSVRSCDLTSHKRIHTGEKLYNCDVCSFICVMSRDLVRHKRKHTGEKPYKCDMCSYSTTRSSLLAEHKARHTGEKSYQCDVCSFSTYSSRSLVLHIRSHSGEKPYKCDVCSYCTARPHDLVRHKRKHTGEKPYKCDVCSYRTNRSDQLADHQARHSGEKLHKCDVCSYSTVRSRDLIMHKRKHSGEKPYKCDVCSYCTVRSHDLATHKRKHTGGKP